MSRSRLEITGLDEARRALRVMARKAPRIARQAVRKGLDAIHARAIEEAPRLTGATAASLVVVMDDGAASGAVALPLEHGVHRDLGTRVLAADDFMRRAADSAAGKAAAIVAAEVARGLA